MSAVPLLRPAISIDLSDVEFDPWNPLAVLWVATALHVTGPATTIRHHIDRRAPLEFQAEQIVCAAPLRPSKTRFTLDGNGEWGTVVGCFDDAGLVDVAAFGPSIPRGRTLLGEAWCLNTEPLFATSAGDPVHVHMGVWNWLVGQGRGLLIIDWRQAALTLLDRRTPGLVVDDIGQGQALRRALGGVNVAFPIFVADEGDRP
jgi:hypothetical protein